MLDILFLQVSFIKWLQRWAMDTTTICSMSTPVKKCVMNALLRNKWFASYSYTAYLIVLIVLFPLLVLLSYGDTDWYYVLEQSTSSWQKHSDWYKFQHDLTQHIFNKLIRSLPKIHKINSWWEAKSVWCCISENTQQFSIKFGLGEAGLVYTKSWQNIVIWLLMEQNNMKIKQNFSWEIFLIWHTLNEIQGN